MNTRIIIIDGQPLVYRADSVSDLTTPQGVRVSGVYGALDVLQLAVESLAPTHLMIVWDWKREELWRRYMYPDYKINREAKTPEDVEKRRIFHEQIKMTYQILHHFPVRQFLQYGMEGDDLAYWITKRMYHVEEPACPICRCPRLTELDIEGSGAWVCVEYQCDNCMHTFTHEYFGEEDLGKIEFVCVTVDRDWLQLIDKNTKVWFSDNQTMVDHYNFEKHTGYDSVEDFLIAKSILGDVGDNVKGVLGIGKKTLAKHASKCMTLEDYATLIPKVEEQYDSACFSRMLIDLSCFPYTKDLDRHLHKVSLPEPDLAKARKLFEELHFTRFLSIWKTWTRVFKGLQV